MEILKIINSIIEKSYPAGEVYEPTISKEVQEKAIQELKGTIPFEQFFLVLNIVDRKLEYVNGFEKWLGYRDDTFSLFDYVKIIHPSLFASLASLADSAFVTANSGEYKLGFMSHSIAVQLPLKHKNGKFILTKRSLYPFQVDKSGKVLSYLNHYVILKEFDEKDVLDPRVTAEGILKEGITNSVLEKSKQNNFEKIKWSVKERAILTLLIEKPSLTHKEIAEELNISLVTLKKTDNHRIIRKAKDFFRLESFSSIKEVAIFLKSQGIL